MDQELKETLLQSQLCKYLDLNDLDMLIGYSKIISFTPGTVLLKQGEKSTGTYIIMYGTADVSAKVINDGEVYLATLEKGDFIGEISLVLNTPSTVSTVAKTAMECLYISSTYFETLALFFPQTRYKISRAVIDDVCMRVKSIYSKIAASMARAHMVSKSMFGDVMQSLTWPKIISLKEVGIGLDFLHEQDFFKNFNAEQMTTLLRYVEVLDAGLNCPLIKSGEKTTSCYIVLRGAVQSSIKKMNKLAKISVLPPLSFFCCMSYIDTMPSLIDYSTCEHTILLKISVANLELLKQEQTEIWYALYNEICKSFAALEQALSKLDIRLNSELYNR